MNLRYLIAEITRPLLAHLPRGRDRLYPLLVGGQDGVMDLSWKSIRRRWRIFFDTTLQAYIYVDLADWGGRKHYYKGRFPDIQNLNLIQRSLGEGDIFIDVGANTGILSLMASRFVGAKGQVFAIEPNPETFRVLEAHMVINRITNCITKNCALGDKSEEMLLFAKSEHSGTCTLRPVSNPLHSFHVPVLQGDEIFGDISEAKRVLVKVDTEGFDHRVVLGMRKLLRRENVAVSIEVTDDWLRQTGSSAAQLFDYMRGMGFGAYKVSLSYRHLFRTQFGLTVVNNPLNTAQYDVVFAKPAFLVRLAKKRSIQAKEA